MRSACICKTQRKRKIIKMTKNRIFQVLIQASWGTQTRAMGMILDAKSTSIQIFGSRALNSSVLNICIFGLEKDFQRKMQRKRKFFKMDKNLNCQVLIQASWDA